MDTHQTVFILGAGASAAYGFPSGPGLRDEIVNLARPNLDIQNTLRACGFGVSDIENFRQELETSNRYSVDAFLEHRPDLLKIGKTAMAISLIAKEAEGILLRRSKPDDWYRYFLSLMPHPKEWRNCQVSFITFNYDRSLEQFLFAAIKASYKLQDSEASEYVAALDILHLHGQLGFLPWQGAPLEQTRIYSPDADVRSIHIATEGIKIIHEARPEDHVFAVALRKLFAANNLFVLGFGYDQTNCSRLRLPELNISGTGTCFKLEGAEVDMAMNNTGGRISLTDNAAKCETWLRRYVRLRFK